MRRFLYAVVACSIGCYAVENKPTSLAKDVDQITSVYCQEYEDIRAMGISEGGKEKLWEESRKRKREELRKVYASYNQELPSWLAD